MDKKHESIAALNEEAKKLYDGFLHDFSSINMNEYVHQHASQDFIAYWEESRRKRDAERARGVIVN